MDGGRKQGHQVFLDLSFLGWMSKKKCNTRKRAKWDRTFSVLAAVNLMHVQYQHRVAPRLCVCAVKSLFLHIMDRGCQLFVSAATVPRIGACMCMCMRLWVDVCVSSLSEGS